MRGLYLVRTREAIRCNDMDVTKFGQSEDLYRRMKEYTKYCDVLFLYECNAHKIYETIALQYFRTILISRKDYGSEYFQGDINVMIEYIKNNIIGKVIDKDVFMKNKGIINNDIENNTDIIIEDNKVKDIIFDNNKDNKDIIVIDNNDYTCKKCDATFEYKSLLIKHLNRKIPCDKLIILNKYSYIELHKIYTNYVHKINEKNKKSIDKKCYFCDKEYSSKSNLLMHVKKSCKEKKKMELEKEKLKLNCDKIKLKEELEQINNKNINIIKNNINN